MTEQEIEAMIAENEALKAKNQSMKVEDGRARKLAQELADAKRRNEELEASLKPTSLRDGLPQEISDGVGDETLAASQHLTNRAVTPLQREISEARKEIMDMFIGSAFPGFFGMTDVGGPYHDQWANWHSLYGASFDAAYNARDKQKITTLINSFYNEARIRNNNANPSGVADPVPGGGGDRKAMGYRGEGKTYTQSEFKALNDALEKAQGTITHDEYVRRDAEIARILSEGRVVED